MWGLASHGVGDRLRTSVPGFSAVGFSELRQCREQLIDNHPTKKSRMGAAHPCARATFSVFVHLSVS